MMNEVRHTVAVAAKPLNSGITLAAALRYEVSVARDANSAWMEGRLDAIQASALESYCQ